MLRSIGWVNLVLVVSLTTGNIARSDTIEVSNPSETSEYVLSDLIVYGENDEKQTLLKPNDSSDDVTIGKLGARVYDVDFKITKYVISRASGENEYETAVFNVKRAVPKTLFAMANPLDDRALVLGIDDDADDDLAPPVGAQIQFFDGLNPAFPYWLVGTSIDFNLPAVLSPYTGVAEVLNHIVVSVVQPGDFDGDGDVDGADFVAWQTKFPLARGATRAMGDADNDGDVDGADFVIWQTHFPTPAGGGAVPVPEPGAFLLALAAMIGLVIKPRRP